MTTERTQMPAEAHPQAAEALEQMRRFQSALSDQIQQVTNGCYTGTDEDKTVEVTVDGTRWLTGLYIEDGLLRLGAEAVGQRVNEALHNAQAAATASIKEQQAQLFSNISDIANSLKTGLGLT